MNVDDRKHLIVIGGGAAGFFGAANAARMNPSLKVTAHRTVEAQMRMRSGLGLGAERSSRTTPGTIRRRASPAC